MLAITNRRSASPGREPSIGDGRVQSGNGGLEVRRSVLACREAFVRSRFGDHAVGELHRAAPRELKNELLRAALGEPGWVPFPALVETTVLVDRLFGDGSLALAREMGRFTALHEAGPWRQFAVRHAPASLVMRLATSVWRQHFSAGSLSVHAESPTCVSARLRDFPVVHRANCLAVMGWCQGLCELGPRTDVVVRELGCRALGDPDCELRVSWRDDGGGGPVAA